MKRIRQSFEEIADSLGAVESDWKDDHAQKVIALLTQIPIKADYGEDDLVDILDRDFAVGLTTIRLLSDNSKDEFTIRLREALPGPGGHGITRYRSDKSGYVRWRCSEF